MAKRKTAEQVRKKLATPAAAPRELSPKRARFVQEYLLDGNGAAAYRRAGYAAKNDHVAAVGAEKLLTNGDIQAAVEAERPYAGPRQSAPPI
jgi:hypothetical protein